jgi:ribosomal protein L7/L12
MANKNRGEVEVELGDQTYPTRLNLDGISRIENDLNMSIVQAAQRLSEGAMQIDQLTVILNRALKGGGNKVEVKDVKKIIWDAGLAEAMKAVGEILSGVLGVSDEDDDEGNALGAGSE